MEGKTLKKKLLSGILALTLSASTGMGVCAEGIDYNINYDYANSSVEVTVNSDGNEFITMHVLGKDKTFEDVSLDDAIYMAQKTAKEPGVYKFIMDYDVQSYEYNALLASSNGDKENFKLILINYEDLSNAVDCMNDMAKENKFDEFAKIINDKRTVLGYGFELSDGKILNDELMDYFAYVKENVLDSTKQTENAKVFKTFITAYQLNNGTLSTIRGLEDKLWISDSLLWEKYNNIAINGEISEYFTEKMSGTSINNLEEYDESFKKALVLTGIKYAKGYGEVKSLLETYGFLFGINDSARSSVYSEMAGNDYTAENIKGQYDMLVRNSKENSSSGGSGGGGGSFSSSSGSSYGGSYTVDNANVNEINGNETIKLTFDDIDGVQWASEAIHALADKGIISGVSEKSFCPDENVTREQFVKILVIAMGLENTRENGNVFSDVDTDAWYCKYVNIAEKYGIVKGIGNGLFGIGDSISREDMCVMLCNALKIKGNAGIIAETAFEDEKNIAPYAVESVKILYGIGAINGVSDTEFSPKSYASRAQAAKVVYGVLDKLQ